VKELSIFDTIDRVNRYTIVLLVPLQLICCFLVVPNSDKTNLSNSIKSNFIHVSSTSPCTSQLMYKKSFPLDSVDCIFRSGDNFWWSTTLWIPLIVMFDRQLFLLLVYGRSYLLVNNSINNITVQLRAINKVIKGTITIKSLNVDHVS
jgi:hypothetical protein